MVPDHFFFILGFCFLLVHEMDAIRAKEWKIFPVLSKMGDDAGYVAFTALHVSIYAALLWGICGNEDTSRGLIFGLDLFFIVHVFLTFDLLQPSGEPVQVGLLLRIDLRGWPFRCGGSRILLDRWADESLKLFATVSAVGYDPSQWSTRVLARVVWGRITPAT